MIFGILIDSTVQMCCEAVQFDESLQTDCFVEKYFC